MPSSEHSHNLDLESGNRAGGGGGGRGPDLFEGNGTVEKNGNNEDKDEKKESDVSAECSVEIILDLESRACNESNLNLGKSDECRDCRICHLSMDQDSGIPIELGCSCKADLAAAHKQCAETWFKIKGNKTCEICGSTAHNVVGVTDADQLRGHENETNDDATAGMARTTTPLSESQNFWHGHRFLNFLLACMVFAFVISWLFHFNVPS